ncbi:MAG TPA: sigma 54-interacting transcriptional regulator [Gemmatimonadaceae bacterium]|nr:sigma 54-interacting transcriptional regulator [Gemmatimonadaceae bacterium]
MAIADVGVSAAILADPSFGFQSIVGESPLLREAIALAERVAGTRRTTVLLIGETGTGKELFARGIHYAGITASEPFVAINCAAIPDTLLESELFGHERGAFTGATTRKQGLLELAGSGTLFLDEVHHLPRLLQPKLLRALESRQIRRLGGLDEMPIDCRIIAAASPLLEQVVGTGEFREDLYYRLNVFSISLPALRDRLDDIEIIARHFLHQEAREYQQPKELSAEAVAALRVHRWPGNVRELKNVIERAAILSADARVVQAEHLMIQRRTMRAVNPEPGIGDIHIPPQGKLLEDIEREAVALTLRLTGGNQAAAARMLGISRPTLAKKMAPRAPQQPISSDRAQ